MTDVAICKEADFSCDGGCGRTGRAAVLLGVAIRPPEGWFVHGVASPDGSIDQLLFCSEGCACSKIDGAEQLVEIARAINERVN